MRQRLVFHHIPKCGGTSLDAAIAACYGDGRPRPPDCLRYDPVAGQAAAQRAGIEELRYAEGWLLERLAQPDTRYLSGHVPFSATAARTFAGEWEFVTLLRHPVARWFSHYFFNRRRTDDYYPIGEELEAFVASPRAQRIANTTLLYVSGRDLSEILTQPDVCIDQAIANLESCAVFGCLERLDDFVARFAARYDVTLSVPRLQASPLPPPAQAAQITAAVRRRVEELCRADLQVYEYALARCAPPAG